MYDQHFSFDILLLVKVNDYKEHKARGREASKGITICSDLG